MAEGPRRAPPSEPPAKGTRPLGFPSFGGYGEQNFGSCLAGTSRSDDRPPTHFFVKKKFGSIGGAAPASQKVSSVLCYAHTFCGGETLCDARNPPAIRFAPGPPPFKQGGKKFLRLTKSAQKPRCGAGSIPHRGGSFFLYEKSVLRESDHLCGRKLEVCTDLNPLFRL